MTTLPERLPPAVASSLALWHEMVTQRDLSRLPTILAEDAVFRSPMAFKPYASAAAVRLILENVMQVFADFEYHRQFATADGLSVVLEFSAKVGEKSLKGADLIRFDDVGRIVDFEVMVRPFNALQALGDEMGKRLAAYLPAYKSQ
jgi:hypothetical protein